MKEGNPVREHYDVIVAGAGPSGIAAAVYAARNGAKVLLLEKEDMPGGIFFQGRFSHWGGSASSGMQDEWMMESVRAWGYDLFDPETWMDAILSKIASLPITMRTHAMCYSVDVKKNTIRKIKVLTPEGKIKVSAHCYIDATGDGLIARQAGIPMDKTGTPEKGISAMMTSRIAGIDTRESRCYSPSFLAELQKKYAALHASDNEHEGNVPVFRIVPCARGGHAMVYLSWSSFSVGEAAQIDRQIHARESMHQIILFLRSHAPGYQDTHIIHMTDHLFTTASYACKCRATIQKDDISKGRIFQDWVVSRVKQEDHLSNPVKEHTGGSPFTIPYRALLPVGIRNLIMTGRSVGASADARAYLMGAPLAIALGQATGTAAALAARDGEWIDLVQADEIQRLLLMQGVAPPVTSIQEAEEIDYEPVQAADALLDKAWEGVPQIPQDARISWEMSVVDADQDTANDAVDDSIQLERELYTRKEEEPMEKEDLFHELVHFYLQQSEESDS